MSQFSERLEEQVEEVQPPIDEQVSDGQPPELINILILNLCGNIHDPLIILKVGRLDDESLALVDIPAHSIILGVGKGALVISGNDDSSSCLIIFDIGEPPPVEDSLEEFGPSSQSRVAATVRRAWGEAVWNDLIVGII